MGREKGFKRTAEIVGDNILPDLDAETGELPEPPRKRKEKRRTRVHSTLSEPPRTRANSSDDEEDPNKELEDGELSMAEEMREQLEALRRENAQLRLAQSSTNWDRENDQNDSTNLIQKITEAVSSNRTISQPLGQMKTITCKAVKGLQDAFTTREKEGLKNSTPVGTLIHEDVQNAFTKYCILNKLVTLNNQTSWLDWEPKAITEKMLLWVNHSQPEGNTQEEVVNKKLSQIKGELLGEPEHSSDNLSFLNEISVVVQNNVSEELRNSKDKLPLQKLRTFIRDNILGKTQMGMKIAEDWKYKPYVVGGELSGTIADKDVDWTWANQDISLYSHYNSAMTALVLAEPYKEKGSRKRSERDDSAPPHPGKKTKDKRDKTPKVEKELDDITCKGCGRRKHTRKECLLKDHPDFNNENESWESSTSGKAWMAKGKSYLPTTRTLDGQEREVPKGMINTKVNTSTKIHKTKDTYHKNKVSDSMYCGMCNDVQTVQRLNNAMSHDCNTPVTYNDDLRTFTINANNNTDSKLRVSVLLDSGALGVGSSYISHATAEKLEAMGYSSVVCNETVCSCFIGKCHKINKKFKIKLSFHDNNQKIQRVTVYCRVAEIPYDVIIGRDVFKHCTKLREELYKDLSGYSEHVGSDTSDNEKEVSSTREMKRFRGSHDLEDPSSRKVDAAVNLNEKIQNLHNSLDNVQQELYQMSLESNYIKEDTFGGSDNLKQQSRAVCEDLKAGFNRELNMEHALITPMEIEIIKDEWGKDLWGGREHMQAPRLQSREKNVEIFSQVLTMLKHKVIRESRASAHSQVMLTPKPNGKWRFCVDYRRLNVVTKPNHWPLPKIKEMFNRLGHKKPKYFAVIDLTKGYYQAPIAEHCKYLTAFITPNGLYEWERVAMGLCGAVISSNK
jgi:hypothetical protein